MDRFQFLKGSLACAAAVAGVGAGADDDSSCDTRLAAQTSEHEFVLHWLGDVLDAMEAELDESTRMSLVAACGRACFRRHPFKVAIADAGRGSVDKLVEAYRSNFEAWQGEDGVHVRYGEVSTRCYCPAAKARPPKKDDLHCECTRATHQAVFESALGRPVAVEVVETLRRGGRTCHFVARI